ILLLHASSAHLLSFSLHDALPISAALTEAESEELFHMINRLREKGIGIVYISHRIEEIKRIADRVTVMRDGQYIDTLPVAETSRSEEHTSELQSREKLVCRLVLDR